MLVWLLSVRTVIPLMTSRCFGKSGFWISGFLTPVCPDQSKQVWPPTVVRVSGPFWNSERLFLSPTWDPRRRRPDNSREAGVFDILPVWRGARSHPSGEITACVFCHLSRNEIFHLGWGTYPCVAVPGGSVCLCQDVTDRAGPVPAGIVEADPPCSWVY